MPFGFLVLSDRGLGWVRAGRLLRESKVIVNGPADFHRLAGKFRGREPRPQGRLYRHVSDHARAGQCVGRYDLSILIDYDLDHDQSRRAHATRYFLIAWRRQTYR